MFQISGPRSGWLALSLGAALTTATGASGAPVTGDYNGLSWRAQSTIVGLTPTGEGSVVIPPSPLTRLGPGGDPAYRPDPSRHSGVASLIMTYSNGAVFGCSGSLLGDRRSIATAGHCVSSGGGVRDANLVSTTAYFWDYATQGDDRVSFNPAATALDVTKYAVHPDYTGQIVDQNDIAVLRLDDLAPAFAQGYDLYAGGDLTGQSFNVAGYGSRSEVGGAAGISDLPSTGYLRQGDNRYDFRLGDADFDTGTPTGSIWNALLAGLHGELEYSYLSDFDSGLLGNDVSCQVTVLGLGLSPSAKYCDSGVGALEAAVAPGDSGGPGFVGGKLASINSYGLTFRTGFGDVDDVLNTSFGEFNGHVPIFLHEDFIHGAMVPEPASWALLITGFGLAGASLRRRRIAA